MVRTSNNDMEGNLAVRYPIFTVVNLSSYARVMSLWGFATLVLAWLLRSATARSVDWTVALVFAGAAVMTGMMILFGASVLNLRKLRPGFKRLAEGDPDPSIPRVWCPVLTMATRSAVELSEWKGAIRKKRHA